MIFDEAFKKLAAENTDEALVAKYQKGELSVINELARRHQDLINYRAGGLRGVPVPMPALEGEGLKILASSARRFEVKAGTRFRTFLESNLRGLNRYAHENKNVLHFPENKRLLISKYKTAVESLTNQLGRTPADWQVADELGWSVPEITKFKAKMSQRELAASGLENLVGSKQEDEAVVSRKQEAAEFLYYSLTNEEKMVYDYALGRHGKMKLRTDGEIAKVTGLNPSKVNRIRKNLASRVQSS